MKATKILTYTGNILAPTHVAMGRISSKKTIFGSTVVTPGFNNKLQMAYSQQLPSGRTVSIMKLVKTKANFYADPEGDMIPSKDLNHPHIVVDGKLSLGLVNRYPISNTQVFDILNLGAGTVEYPNSLRTQYVTKKEEPLMLDGVKNIQELPGSDTYTSEAKRQRLINEFIFLDEPENKPVKKVYEFEYKNPENIPSYANHNNKKGKAFRKLIKQQVKEIVNDEIKDEHIIRIVKK